MKTYALMLVIERPFSEHVTLKLLAELGNHMPNHVCISFMKRREFLSNSSGLDCEYQVSKHVTKTIV